MTILFTVGTLGLFPNLALAGSDLKDHGVPVPLAERRGVVVTEDGQGQALVIACSMDQGPRGWVLVTNITTGETVQVYCPEGVANSPAYGSVLARTGKFYTSQGGVLLEFDPTLRQWTFHGTPAPQASAYLVLIEAPDGTIWGGDVYRAGLASFNPKTREMKDYGRMDDQEQYLSALAVDDRGWVYCGIGTSRGNLVAFFPPTGEKRQIVPEEARTVGTGSVYRGVDGKVYGQVTLSDGTSHYRLWEGVAERIPEGEKAPAEPNGALGWGSILNQLPDGRRVTAYDLEEKWLDVQDSPDGPTRRISFDYESEGAYVRLIHHGPGGLLYGGSGHPPWAFAFDPRTGRMDRFLGRVRSWQGLDSHGSSLFSSEYSGGWLSVYDTTRPWTGEGPAATDNPRVLAEYTPAINQPFVTRVHPSGRQVVTGGWPGYGYVGGGLGIYEVETEQSLLLPHTDLAPNQSTVSLTFLPSGDLLAGTSISGGHGTTPVTQEGILYLLDWATKKKVWETVPVPGASEVAALETGPDGLVYGFTNPAEFFVFDPQARQILYRYDLRSYGSVAYHGLTQSVDGSLYVALTQALLRIMPGRFTVEKLADAPGPITAGTAVAEGRLYFIVNSHLWSLGLGS